MKLDKIKLKKSFNDAGDYDCCRLAVGVVGQVGGILVIEDFIQKEAQAQ